MDGHSSSLFFSLSPLWSSLALSILSFMASLHTQWNLLLPLLFLLPLLHSSPCTTTTTQGSFTTTILLLLSSFIFSLITTLITNPFSFLLFVSLFLEFCFHCHKDDEVSGTIWRCSSLLGRVKVFSFENGFLSFKSWLVRIWYMLMSNTVISYESHKYKFK